MSPSARRSDTRLISHRTAQVFLAIPPTLHLTPSQNAGFLIPPTFRGLKIGKTLGKSYLFYGPALGYRGSVFNLVFKSRSLFCLGIRNMLTRAKRQLCVPRDLG